MLNIYIIYIYQLVNERFQNTKHYIFDHNDCSGVYTTNAIKINLHKKKQFIRYFVVSNKTSTLVEKQRLSLHTSLFCFQTMKRDLVQFQFWIKTIVTPKLGLSMLQVTLKLFRPEISSIFYNIFQQFVLRLNYKLLLCELKKINKNR